MSRWVLHRGRSGQSPAGLSIASAISGRVSEIRTLTGQAAGVGPGVHLLDSCVRQDVPDRGGSHRISGRAPVGARRSERDPRHYLGSRGGFRLTTCGTIDLLQRQRPAGQRDPFAAADRGKFRRSYGLPEMPSSAASCTGVMVLATARRRVIGTLPDLPKHYYAPATLRSPARYQPPTSPIRARTNE